MINDKAIGYCWQPEDGVSPEGMLTLEQQKQAIFHYCGNRKKILHYYVETHDKKHRELPQFLAAVAQAKKDDAELVIAQLQTLTRYESFTTPLLESKVRFHCIDQPLVNHETLLAVVANVHYLRERHSKRIREGLYQSLSQLGNPHALQEITKVNKPKTESAILFAMVLAPIIAYYRISGYSQRKMVQVLNDEGFLAPEGGPWVLSQLQKVLERVDLNNLALDLTETLDDFSRKQYTPEQMVKGLKAMRISLPNKETWDVHELNKVIDRLHAIRELLEFNQFVLEKGTELFQIQAAGLSYSEIADKLNKDQLPLPERVQWELEQDKAAGHAVTLDAWTPANVELTLRIAKRRKDDIESYIRPETLSRSEALFREFIGDDAE
jgi:DNA-binding phage protein